MTSVSVKWGKQRLDVDADIEESPAVFKAQLFALTGVPPDRMKIMFKGKQLKDDTWTPFISAGLKPGTQIMMIGSSEAVPAAPSKKTVFVEDLTEAQLSAAFSLPLGLRNLGNTCYMNATLQCLKTVPPLCDALKANQTTLTSVMSTSNPSNMLSTALRDLYSMMDSDSVQQNALAASQSDGSSVVPMIMVQVLHTVAPQFAERDENGRPQQQDAQECWTTIMDYLRQSNLKLSTENSGDVITQFVSGKLKVTLKCKEDESESPSFSEETFYMLPCFLSQDVKYIHSGLKARLTEEITKRSEKLGRDALYSKESLLDRLPAFLPITIMRFHYKEKEKINAKILKDVKFTMTLDVFEFCTEELKQKLIPMRSRLKRADDFEMDRKKLAKAGEDLDEIEQIQIPFSFEDDPGSNNSGFYELQAVLTHKGRSSTSGHYVAWVKRTSKDGKHDTWLMCDDETVAQVQADDVLRLSGGGDWHTAYILLYGPRILHEPKNGYPEAESKTTSENKNAKSQNGAGDHADGIELD